MADAISSIEANRNGIDLRTVQVWFQDNDNGISSENIRWLARVFGCDDPEAASDLQTELSAARSKLDAKRREKRGAKATPAASASNLEEGSHADENAPDDRPAEATKPELAPSPTSPFGLISASEALFSRSPLNLPASVFAGAVALQFTSYFLGIHEVTFEAPDGLAKQVGFPKLQAPELKYRALSRRQTNHPRLLALMRDLLGEFKCVTYVCDKRFMLTLMFVDYAVEPYYYERGLDFYANGQNYAMASMLHMAGPALLGEPQFERLMESFQRAMKEKTCEALNDLVSAARATGRVAKVVEIRRWRNLRVT